MQQHFFGKLTLLVFALFLTAAQAADALKLQRDRFLDARQALTDRKLDEFHRIGDSLRDYPLYPYLEFWYLRDRLVASNSKQIGAFIDRYADQPVGVLLRRSWLNKLASARDWKTFLALYAGAQPVALQCYRLRAKLATGDKDQLTEDALKLWLVGRSQDSACDPVFEYLETQGAITSDLRWQRIRLAMKGGNTSLSEFLARRLPKDDQAWLSVWREAHTQPARALDSRALASDTARTREVILHALHRLARSDVEYAHERWSEIRSRYHFDVTDANEVDKDIALIAGWRRHPDAHGWLSAVADDVADSEVREWRIRSAITDGLWTEVLRHIENMPADEVDSEEWRYWRGIALGNTAQQQLGKDQLSALARERDYYGFLAADELRWPYVMDHRPIEYTADEMQELQLRPGIVRARELDLAGLMTESRREWAAVTEDMNARELKLAARLASDWGWHDRAILTVARSADYDDLELRFPLDHVDDVNRYAGEYQLDPGHVYAVIRTESAFNTDARSGAGALGLMQLMPATGRVTARKNRIPLPGTQHLYEPDSNIRIGSAYLKEVMNRYDNNVVLASAAYNAGPQRVQRWLPDEQTQSAASWVAAIPFDETRKYVQRILAYAAIYDWRLQRRVIPLAEHMQDIKPRDAYRDDSR
jgi:soluble lytic murein transglycosylase